MDADIQLETSVPGEPLKMSVHDWKLSIAEVALWPTSYKVPGVVVLVESARHQGAFISRMIANTQRRALRQLAKKIGREIDEEVIRFYAGFTHAGIIGTPFHMYHMTFPRAQRLDWDAMRGERILVRTLSSVELSGSQLSAVSMSALDDIGNREPYDWRDLLGFWIRWNTYLIGPKLHFHQVFGSDNHDVCSTRVIEWYVRAGILPETYRDRKWSYYPAHLAMSAGWITVGYYELT